MKRFFCTICKKSRRVRRFPSNIQNQSSESVTDRIGTCAWHVTHVTHSRARVLATSVKGGR